MQTFPIGNGTLAPRIPKEIAALMAALQMQGAHTDALLALETNDWVKLLDFCDPAHLALPLAQIQRTGFPDFVIQRLDKNIADNSQRFERVRAAYQEVAKALTEVSVPYLVLKGFSQAPDYVRHPRFRIQSDIDIYCPAEYTQVARGALEEIGYSPMGGVDYSQADHAPTMARLGKWVWQGNMYDPEMPVSIELHFCLWNEKTSLIEIPDIKHFWQRRINRRFDGYAYPALNKIDQLGYFSLHILRGTLSGDWILHHVHELATFLHNHTDDHDLWDEWLSAHAAPLRNLEGVAFALAEAYFSCSLPEAVRRQIETMPASQKAWLERFGGSPLQIMFRRNRDGRLLHLFLATTKESKKLILRKALFPMKILGPGGAQVRVRNRRVKQSRPRIRILDYLLYQGNRLFVGGRAVAEFVSHGIWLWLLNHQLRGEFWLFLTTSFFLTWACLPICSCSIYF
jgi:hypothetical protein